MQQSSRRGFFKTISFVVGGLSLPAMNGIQSSLCGRHVAVASPIPSQGEFATLDQSAAYLGILGVNPDHFLKLWQAIMDADGPLQPERAQIFLRSFARVLRDSSDEMREEVVLLSGLLDRFWGRLAIFGHLDSLASVSPKELASRVDLLATSKLSFRRKARMGLVTLIGISHFGEPLLAADSGYPGVPPHIQKLWGQPRIREGGRGQ